MSEVKLFTTEVLLPLIDLKSLSNEMIQTVSKHIEIGLIIGTKIIF